MTREMIIMRTFKPRAFSVSDFYSWYKDKQLVLNPDFQRRAVWSPQSKSNLVNTILLGLPLPIFFIRNKTDKDTRKVLREVVDGQQRLRAIFDFLDNGFRVNKSQSEEHGGKLFSELPEDVQTDFFEYELSVNALVDLSDNEVLDIFARLNSYGVRLNKQELLNAKYFGYFKQLAYALGLRYTTFWVDNKVFTTAKIVRMAEVEFVSDMLVVMLDGIQSQATFDKYYKTYDETFDERFKIEKRFCEIIDIIGNIFESELKSSEFSKTPILYSLFTALYHMKYNVKDFNIKSRDISIVDFPKIRAALNEIEEVFDKDELTSEEQKFVVSCKKSTTDKASRVVRSRYIMSIINKHVMMEV